MKTKLIGGILMKKEQRYCADINDVIIQLFDEESENFKYKLEDIDLTAFFTALVLEFCVLYGSVTGNKEDLIDTVSTINRLVHQYTYVKEETNV
jgi:hypothetical protein